MQEEERDEALLPLVRLWFDFPAILEQDDIPDPRELFAERDTIVR